MKINLVAGAFLGASITSALAADLPVMSAPPVIPIYSWSGVYLGVNIGYGGEGYNYPFLLGGGNSTIVTPNSGLTSSGVLGGGQIGANYELHGILRPQDGIVAGAEADFDGASINGNGVLNATSPLANGSASGNAFSKMTSYSTVRGRLGYAVDRLLIYGTGGYAFSSTKSGFFASIGNIGNIVSPTATTHDNGIVFGGGLEYAITDNITVKLEYLHSRLSTQEFAYGSSGIRYYNVSVQPNINVMRIGANYKFDLFGSSSSPIAAKY